MPTLDDVIDSLGVGFGQYIIVALGGEVYSGLVKTLVTTCSVSFAHDLGFSALQRGWLVSMLFVGNFIGNLSSGALSDFCGRRPTLLLGYSVATLSLLASALVSNFVGALAYRTGFGVAAGLMGPTCWTLLGEIAPAKSRYWMHSLGHFSWFLGGISMLLLIHLSDPTMKDVPWRGFTTFTLGVTFVCMSAAIYFLIESPSFLCLKGRREDAIAVLETLQKRNGAGGDIRNWEMRQTEVQANERCGSWSYMALFDRTSLYTTLTLAFSTFTLNYSSYGMMYALPIILSKSRLGVVPSITMMLVMTCGLIGIVSGVAASNYSQSRPGFLGYVFLVRAVCVACFMVGLWRRQGDALTVTFALFGIFGKTLLDSIAYVLVYLYAVEVRPTQSRASGSGFALGVGRLGGVVAPLIFEIVRPASFVLSVLVLGLGCAALVLVLPIETKDRQLGEIADEVTVLPKLAQA